MAAIVHKMQLFCLSRSPLTINLAKNIPHIISLRLWTCHCSISIYRSTKYFQQQERCGNKKSKIKKVAVSSASGLS